VKPYDHPKCVYKSEKPATSKLLIRRLAGNIGAKEGRARRGRRNCGPCGMAEAAIAHTVLEPMAVLRPFIKRFEVTQYLTERTHTLLPDTSLVACFRLDRMAIRHEARILPAAFLSGLQDRARTLTRLAGSCVLLTIFSEVGAAAFLREPLDLLFNRMMPLDSLLRRSQLEEVHEQLVEARDHARRKEILERLC